MHTLVRHHGSARDGSRAARIFCATAREWIATDLETGPPKPHETRGFVRASMGHAMRREYGLGLAAAAVLAGLAAWRYSGAGAGAGADAGASVSVGVGAGAGASATGVGAPLVLGSARAAEPARTVELGWGSGENQLGRKRPQEGNPEGPMSLAGDGNDNTLVLDQVNGRILRLGADGRMKDEMKLPVLGAQDVAVGKDGSIAVLDRLADKTVAVMGPDGKLVGRLPLEGKGVTETGGVTGVFVDGKKVFVEVEHGALVSIGDTSGNADPDRSELPGRPSRDGKYLWSAGIVDKPQGRMWIASTDRPSLEHRFTRELGLGMPMMSIVLLDTDQAGTVYLGTVVELAPGSDGLLLTCIASTDGHVLGSVQLPVNILPEETFRDLAVLDGGGVVYQHRTEKGVTLSRYDCR